MRILFNIIYCLSLSSSLHAIEAGLLIPIGSGSANGVHLANEDDSVKRDFDADIDLNGLGFFVDLKNKSQPFFIRSSINYEKCSYRYQNSFSHDFKRLSLDSTVCFNVLSRDIYSFWAGPQIRLALMHAKDENRYIESELFAFGIGLAPSFGLNIKISDSYSMGIQTGYRFNYYYGHIDESGYYGFYEEDGEFHNSENELFYIFLFTYNFNQY